MRNVVGYVGGDGPLQTRYSGSQVGRELLTDRECIGWVGMHISIH